MPVVYRQVAPQKAHSFLVPERLMIATKDQKPIFFFQEVLTQGFQRNVLSVDISPYLPYLSLYEVAIAALGPHSICSTSNKSNPFGGQMSNL